MDVTREAQGGPVGAGHGAGPALRTRRIGADGRCPHLLPPSHPNRCARRALHKDRRLEANERHQRQRPRCRARHPRRARAAHPDPGSRPRRPDRWLPAGQAGPARDHLRGRGPGGRHRQDRGARRPGRRVPLRSRWASLLHEGEGGRRPLARDHARGVPQAPADVAHLLEQEVPRLPAARPGRDQEARPGRAHPRVPVLPLGAAQAQGTRGHLRAVGVQPLRQAALRPVLPLLHREGLGRAHVRDPRRVGGPADQGPVLLQRREGRVLRQQGRRDQDADRRVPLPALRPGTDVGDDDRRHPEARRADPDGDAGGEAASSPTAA